MVAAPPNFRGDLKISDQNNWRDLSKKLNLGGGGAMNIVGKGDPTPSFLDQPSFSNIPPF